MSKQNKEKKEIVLREDADSTLKEVLNWLAQGDKEAAINEIQMYGAAEYAHGFEGGRLFERKIFIKQSKTL